jgi:hypothetical protein
VFNANFNNISVILWQSISSVEKTTDMSKVTDKLYPASRTPPHERDSNSQR